MTPRRNNEDPPTRTVRLKLVYLEAILASINKTPNKVPTSAIRQRFNMHPTTAEKYLEHLAINGQIEKTVIGKRTFWRRLEP